MKVLHIYKTYYPESLGGVEQLIFSLSQSLVAHNIQSDVLATTSAPKAYHTKTPYNSVLFYPKTFEKFSCPVSLRLLTNFKKISQDYDILHFHFPWPYADLLHLLNNTSKPSVLTYHSDIVKQKNLNLLYQPLMRQFLKKINKVATTSENLLMSSKALQPFKDKISIVPIGVDVPAAPDNAVELCKTWQERFSQPFFLFIGVLRYYKGLAFLLEAVKNTSVCVVVAGDGPEKNNLLELKKKLKLDNVHFVGAVSEQDKWALLKTCYSVISPAHLRTEAFCISLLEGLMHQKPLISTELKTGTSFVNTHNFSGLVVPPENPSALFRAMQTLLDDKELYQTLKRNTLEHYHKYFTAGIMAEGYLKIYQSLCTTV